MNKHLAIFSQDAIKQVFEGKKTVETRFSQKRIAPFGMVSVGDIVYIKPPGGDIKGQFVVSKVISFENIDNTDWELIRKTFGKKLSLGGAVLDGEYFNRKSDAKFGTLIFIDRVEKFLLSPLKISKKDQRGWMVL